VRRSQSESGPDALGANEKGIDAQCRAEGTDDRTVLHRDHVVHDAPVQGR
jgi:hypothetical protein